MVKPLDFEDTWSHDYKSLRQHGDKDKGLVSKVKLQCLMFYPWICRCEKVLALCGLLGVMLEVHVQGIFKGFNSG